MAVRPSRSINDMLTGTSAPRQKADIRRVSNPASKSHPRKASVCNLAVLCMELEIRVTGGDHERENRDLRRKPVRRK